MAPISAKPTFGTLRPNLYQSDYINRKKGLSTFCKTPAYCNKLKVASSYSNLNLFKNRLQNCKILPINKSNLIIGQYTKLNIDNICTVSDINYEPAPCGTSSDSVPCNPCQINNPVIIDPASATNPFYYTYQIDPIGELFGKSQCGELNYIHYMNFYPPKPPLLLNIN
jgi:hypothetical protein